MSEGFSDTRMINTDDVNHHIDLLCSRIDQMNAEEESSRFFADALSQLPVDGRMCHDIAVLNTPVLTLQQITSMESKLLFSRLLNARSKAKAFVNHPRIAAIFVPLMRKEAPGTITLTLTNPALRMHKVILKRHPIGQAALILTNWNRSVHASQSLRIASEVTGCEAAKGVNIGLVKLLWDEFWSDKAIIEEDDIPRPVFIPESEPILNKFSKAALEGFIRKSLMPPSGDSDPCDPNLRAMSKNWRFLEPPSAPELDLSGSSREGVVLDSKRKVGDNVSTTVASNI